MFVILEGFFFAVNYVKVFDYRISVGVQGSVKYLLPSRLFNLDKCTSFREFFFFFLETQVIYSRVLSIDVGYCYVTIILIIHGLVLHE